MRRAKSSAAARAKGNPRLLRPWQSHRHVLPSPARTYRKVDGIVAAELGPCPARGAFARMQ
eukprot:917533-Alexandrium_andersonii.AAC.1